MDAKKQQPLIIKEPSQDFLPYVQLPLNREPARDGEREYYYPLDVKVRRATFQEVEPRVLKSLKELFEVDTGKSPVTFFGIQMPRERLTNRLNLKGGELSSQSDEDNLSASEEQFNNMQDAYWSVRVDCDKLTDSFGDIINDELVAKSALATFSNGEWRSIATKVVAAKNAGRYSEVMSEFAEEVAHLTDQLFLLAILARDVPTIEFLRQETRKTIDHPEAGRYFSIARNSDGVGDSIELVDADVGDIEGYPRLSYRYLFDAKRNPRSAQRKLRAQLTAMYSGEFESIFVPAEDETNKEAGTDELDVEPVDKDVSDDSRTPAVEFEILPNQELKFEILPADTNLRHLAEELVSQSSEGEKAHVDLGRLTILDEMRKLFGEDHCYFAKGISTGRSYSGEDGERVDEDFIVLVMQHHDALGHVEREDALAISPIARRHAAFYMRQDVSEGLSWREVFALTKTDAQDLGVRRMKFTAPDGVDVYDAMLEKLFMLADCPAEDFGKDLAYDEKAGCYKTRQRRVRDRLVGSLGQLV